jgi:hypothetical protein
MAAADANAEDGDPAEAAGALYIEMAIGTKREIAPLRSQ